MHISLALRISRNTHGNIVHLLLALLSYRLQDPCTHLAEVSTLYEQFSPNTFSEIVPPRKNIPKQVSKMLYLVGSGAPLVHTKWKIRVIVVGLLTPFCIRHLPFRMDVCSSILYHQVWSTGSLSHVTLPVLSVHSKTHFTFQPRVFKPSF